MKVITKIFLDVCLNQAHDFGLSVNKRLKYIRKEDTYYD